MQPEIDLPSSAFRPRVYGVGAWTDNLFFAYDLVATLKPKVLVELGTDRGESYFAFCQSVAENNTGTRCFAVDTWLGDQQAGDYDETTFREVSQQNAEHYAQFSTLRRCTFDEALGRFAAETIDVLHLDGLHTEEAVRHDVAAWLPKIKPGGILLMHDVAVRTRDFGVWKVWDELRSTGRSFTFVDGPGLGVWQKPPGRPLPLPLEAMLDATDNRGAAFAEYYRGKAQETQQLIRRHWQDRTIGETPAGSQSIIQVFYTSDGTHREEETALARIGHEEWKQVSIPLPQGAGAAPLRIDFVSPFTTIDIASIELASDAGTIFVAREPSAFAAISVSGDAERGEHSRYLRLKITGIDPQLYLPSQEIGPAATSLRLAMSLRVSQHAPLD